MNTLKFKFTSTDLFSLNISINSTTVDYNIVDNEIIVNHDILTGFHQIKFQVVDPTATTNIRIDSADLDGSGFMQTLYTMYKVDNNKKSQTTILTQRDNVLYLPFINPVSQWIASCAEKITGRLYSSGLYEELEVYYPESIMLSNNFPKIIQDFFSTNLDFYAHPKQLLESPYYNKHIPYITLPKKINVDEDTLYNELMNNLDYLKSTGRSPKQHEYTQNKNPNRWLNNDIIISSEDDYSLTSKFLLDKNKLPNLYSFIKELNLKTIIHAFIGILGPGEYAYPHIDEYITHEHSVKNYLGCSEIYIPIKWKEGNYFKLNNVGLIPIHEPALINNHNFCHALVNNSDEIRFSLAIVGSELNR